MKFLSICLALLLLSPPSFSQQKSENKAQNVSRQDIEDLKNDIRDLEADIKQAEIDDPDEVINLKKQLEAMKKLLSLMTGHVAVSAPQAVKSTSASLRSSIVPIILKSPVSIPTATESSERLLWYRGKRINDSTLITPGGMIVQFRKTSSQLVVQPFKKQDRFADIAEELNNTEQRKIQLTGIFSHLKNAAFYYPSLRSALHKYDQLARKFNEALKNTFDLHMAGSSYQAGVPETQDNYQAGPSFHPFHAFERSQRWREIIKTAAQKLASLPKPEDDIPSPPERDLSVCRECDTSIEKREEREEQAWLNRYKAKEQEIAGSVMEAMRQLELSDLQISDKDPDLQLGTKVIYQILDRMDKKNQFLARKFIMDPSRQETVIVEILSTERQRQLLGGTAFSAIATRAIQNALSDSVQVRLMKERMEARDYNYVLNLIRFLGIERQRQLLGLTDPDKDPGLGDLVNMSINFNRFALTMDFDFIYQQTNNDQELEMKATGNFQTKNKIYVQLYIDSCSWRMHLYNTDYGHAREDDYALPLDVMSGSKTIRNEEDQFISIPYSGPKELKMQFPDFNIDFCRGRLDTVILTALNYPIGLEQTPQTTLKTYKSEFLAIANLMFIDPGKLEGHTGDGMNLAADIMDALSRPQVPNPSGNDALDKLQDEYYKRKISDDYKKKIAEMGLNTGATILFQANNGSSVLIDKYVDTKHQIDENKRLTKGMIHLRVVHDSENTDN